MKNENRARRFNFGNFTLDLERRLLLRAGEPVPLTPKAFETLALLVRRSGHVVSKDELLDEIWADAFVEESTIAQNVFTLRKALGQSHTENQFIETVPKHGYRFIADVTAIDGATNAKPEIGQHRAAHDLIVSEKISDAEISDAETGKAEIGDAVTVDAASKDARATENEGGEFAPVNVTADAASNLPTAGRRDLRLAQQRTRFNFQTKWLALALLLAVAVAVGLFRFTQGDKAASDFAALSPLTRTTQLTNTGQVLRAAVSPDGKYVAYIQSERGQESLWLRHVEVASGIEIVQPSGSQCVGITFAPESNSVFYVKYDDDSATGGLYQVPALGGAARKVLTDIDSQISFAPDKKRFAFVRNDLSRKEAHLIIASLDDANQQQHLAVHAGVNWITDGAPAWSPDGKIIIFTARVEPSKGASTKASLVEVQVADGKQTILNTRQWDAIQAIEWLADGTSLIVAARDNASLLAYHLWQIDYPGGAARAITDDLNSYSSAGVTADMKSLVTILHRRVVNLWIAPSDRAREAVQIHSGNSKDLGWTLGVEWLRDDKIIYGSTASGKEDVWLMDADGSNQKQLTTTAGANFEPTVSDDGRTVVYVSKAADAAQRLWKMNLDNGDCAPLTNGVSDLRPDISPDGRWVVYMSIDKGTPTLWKTSIDGGEAAIQLLDKIASVPRISPDGRLIACFYRAQVDTFSKLAVLPFDGGEPVKVFDKSPTTFVEAGIQWTPDGRALSFIDNRDGISNIWLQPLDGSPAKQLTNFTSETIFRFAWSPDGKMIVAERGTETGDIVLINK